MAAREGPGARPKIKVERLDGGGGSAVVGPLISLWDSASGLAQPSVESVLAPGGGGNVRLTLSAYGVGIGQESQRDEGNLHVINSKDGVAVSAMASCAVKVPKFAGNTNLEAFLAQFELLAASVGWLKGKKHCSWLFASSGTWSPACSCYHRSCGAATRR